MRKTAMLLIGAGSLVTVLAAGILSRERILEAWHLAAIRSDDPAARAAASEKLIAMRSVRAVLVFLEDWPDREQPESRERLEALLAVLDRERMARLAEFLREEAPPRWLMLAEIHCGAEGPGRRNP